VILAFIGVKLVLEAIHANQYPFAGEREPLESVPHIPIWLSLTIILGVLIIATVASLLKTRGEQPDDDTPAEVEQGQAPVSTEVTGRPAPTPGPTEAEETHRS
jgi:tellurite resistance protein TerC